MSKPPLDDEVLAHEILAFRQDLTKQALTADHLSTEKQHDDSERTPGFRAKRSHNYRGQPLHPAAPPAVGRKVWQEDQEKVIEDVTADGQGGVVLRAYDSDATVTGGAELGAACKAFGMKLAELQRRHLRGQSCRAPQMTPTQAIAPVLAPPPPPPPPQAQQLHATTATPTDATTTTATAATPGG